MNDYMQPVPGLAPRFKQEMDDYDLINPARNKNVAWAEHLTRRQAGPKSQYFMNKDEDMQMKRQFNQQHVARNRMQQNVSDRDMQWRQMQEDRDWKRQQSERAWEADEDDRKYRREQDEYSRDQKEREQKAAYYRALANSSNDLDRVEGLKGLRDLSSGGTPTGSKAAAFSARANEPAIKGGEDASFWGGEAGSPQSAGGGESIDDMRMAQYRADRKKKEDDEARRIRNEEEDRRRELARDDRDQARFDTSEYKAEDRADKNMRIQQLQSQLAIQRDPMKQAEIQRQIDAINLSVKNPNLPTSGRAGALFKGINDSVQGSSDARVASIAPDAYNPSAADQITYKAQERTKEAMAKNAGVKLAIEAINTDFQTMAKYNDLSRGIKEVAYEADDMWFNDPISANDVSAMRTKVTALANEMSQSLGVSANDATSAVLAKISADLNASDRDRDVVTSIIDALGGGAPQQADVGPQMWGGPTMQQLPQGQQSWGGPTAQPVPGGRAQQFLNR